MRQVELSDLPSRVLYTGPNDNLLEHNVWYDAINKDGNVYLLVRTGLKLHYLKVDISYLYRINQYSIKGVNLHAYTNSTSSNI